MTCRVIVELAAVTSTRTGLKVRAELDPGDWPKSTNMTDKDRQPFPSPGTSFTGLRTRPRGPQNELQMASFPEGDRSGAGRDRGQRQ